MSKKIPFLQMFAALCQWQELAEAVEGWVIVAAAIDKASRSALVTLDGARGAGANLIRQAEEAVARCYGLASVKFQMAAPEPETPAEAPAPAAPSVPASAPQTRPAHPRQGESTAPEMDAFARTEAIRREALRKARGSAPAARPKGKGEGKPSGKTIFGHVIKKRPTPIGELELDMGMVVIEGDVFAVDNRELKKRGIHHLKVVYSEEPPIPTAGAGQADPDHPGRRSTPGSVAFVPSVGGLILAGEVIKDLIKAKK